MQGKLILVVGPSASGKTHLVSKLLQKVPNSTRLITTTTRSPRPHERDGKDFFFLTIEDFKKEIQAGNFIEHAEVYGNLYGSSKKVLGDCLQKYKYVFATINVQGVKSLKAEIPSSFSIFIRPGSIEDIKRRLLQDRKGVSDEETQKRIATAEYELSLAPTFDAVVDNIEGHLEDAAQNVLGILSKIE